MSYVYDSYKNFFFNNRLIKSPKTGFLVCCLFVLETNKKKSLINEKKEFLSPTLSGLFFAFVFFFLSRKPSKNLSKCRFNTTTAKKKNFFFASCHKTCCCDRHDNNNNNKHDSIRFYHMNLSSPRIFQHPTASYYQNIIYRLRYIVTNKQQTIGSSGLSITNSLVLLIIIVRYYFIIIFFFLALVCFAVVVVVVNRIRCRFLIAEDK